MLLSLLLPDPNVVLLDVAPLDIGGPFTLFPPRFVLLLLLLIDPVPEPVVDIEPAAVDPAALRSVFAPPMPVELPVLLLPVDVEPWTLVALPVEPEPEPEPEVCAKPTAEAAPMAITDAMARVRCFMVLSFRYAADAAG